MSNISRVNHRYDIIHHMSYYSPFNKGNAKHVMTVYDLSILRYPQTISLAWRHYNRFSLKKSINRSDAIITISQAIKEELISVFPGIRKEKVFSCPVGLNPEYLQFQPKEELLSSISIEPFSYFLFVGDLTKRKNLPFLLSNFLLAKRKGMINQSTKIILVGKRAWGYYEISPFLKKEEGIIEMGYLSPELIIALYKYCKCLIFPSIYEGFGIPIIEAISQNAPIIISQIPTSIELNKYHGNQMLSFVLDDSKGFIQLLELVDKDWQNIRDNLTYGDCSRYTYESIAREHLKIYKDIVSNK